MKLYRVVILVLISTYSAVGLALPTARITIRVVDETGLPVAGANAGLVLEAPKKKGKAGERIPAGYPA